jgi:tetratricopeptide (TPR) repeat protein
MIVEEWSQAIHAAKPFVGSVALPTGVAGDSVVVVVSHDGRTVLRYAPAEVVTAAAPESATEPPPPEEIASADELYVTGVHLAQYRHATRSPEPYWREALRRDAGDARSNTALGVFHLKRGEFAKAEEHLRRAIARLTLRNPNPYDGEPFYQLGLTLRYRGRSADAYAAFYKATWNAAWRGPAYRALAELDLCKQDWAAALEHIGRSLRADADNLNAQCLRAVVLRRLERTAEAEAQLAEAIAVDALYPFTRHLLSGVLPVDGQGRLDLAFEYARCGLLADAVAVCSAPVARAKDDGSATMLAYVRAVLMIQMGDGGWA